MAPSDPATIRTEAVAGWVLLGGSALLIVAGILFSAGEAGYAELGEWKPTALGFGLLVTLFGLIAFGEALRERGERLLPRFGSAAFAIGSTCFIVADALSQGTGRFVYELERIYTVLACVTIALYGWSILRSKALSSAVGWFAIAWAVLDGILYVARIFQAPLGPNVATLVFGAALVAKARWSSRPRSPGRGSVGG
jgi:hypothetical protein